MAMASGDELFAALVAASPPDELPAKSDYTQDDAWDLAGLRLLERTVARIGRRHVGFAFASWVRVMKREERRLAALRAFDRSLRRWSRSSMAASRLRIPPLPKPMQQRRC